MDFSRIHGKTVGNFFPNIATWTTRSVRLLGYFPLTLKTDTCTGNKTLQLKTFKFTWFGSILPYFSCLQIVGSCTWCFVFLWRYKEFQEYTDFQTPTETVAFNLVTLTSVILGIYARLLGLIKGKRFEEFWQNTHSLLDLFPVEGGRDQAPPKFQKIKTSCRFQFFLILIPVIIHVIYFRIWDTITATLDDLLYHTSSSSKVASLDTQLDFGFAFWSTTTMLHAWNGVWLNFFMKIYTECFNCLAEELKQFNRWDKEHHQRNPPPKVHNAPDSPSNVEKIRKYGPTDLSAILYKLTRVEDEISSFNEFFGNLLLFQVGNAVMCLLAYSFFACMWAGRGSWDAFLETIVPMYLFGKELLDMGTAAENLCAAADQVLHGLSEDAVLDSELSEELYLKVSQSLPHGK